MPEGVNVLSEEMKKLAIGYIRVSTKGQDDEGQSLDDQTARIRNYASEKGLALGGIYEDIASAVPGKPDARPDFLRAINAAKAQDSVLVVTDVDRLSRSYKEVKEQIIDAGIPVHVVSLNRLFGQMTLLKSARAAEAAAAKIGRDTKTALAGKSARGGAPRCNRENASERDRQQPAEPASTCLADRDRHRDLHLCQPSPARLDQAGTCGCPECRRHQDHLREQLDHARPYAPAPEGKGTHQAAGGA